MRLKEDFFREEVRCDYLINSKMKRIWGKELEILDKFDEVCQKCGFRYFLAYGTLLGAVRHEGFIPWDNDIDVAMFRDEYEKFSEIAEKEFKDPFEFQKNFFNLAFGKIRIKGTTAVEVPYLDDKISQGLYIDIFPLDDVPKEENCNESYFQIEKELAILAQHPDIYIDQIRQGFEATLTSQIIVDLLRLSPKDRIKEYEDFCLKNVGSSKWCGYIHEVAFTNEKPLKKEWFDTIIYLPFEGKEYPVPLDYDNVLKNLYGDYSKMIQGLSDHEKIIMDPDNSYDNYLVGGKLFNEEFWRQ